MGVSMWDAVHSHSVDWSRCPGSMARRDRDNLASLRQSSADRMPARRGRLSASAQRRHPVTVRQASLMAGPIRRVWALRQQGSALLLNLLELRWLFVALLPHQPILSQQAASWVRRLMSDFCEVARGVDGMWASCPTL